MNHTSAPRALAATSLTKRFRSGRGFVEVLRGVDFEAMHGEVTMVMGPSGSGKSTLIATLSGLMKPDGGQVMALGEDLWSRRPGKIDRFRLDHCGFVFQGFNLFPALTALQQVTTVLKYKGVPKRTARAMAEEALIEVGLDNAHAPAAGCALGRREAAGGDRPCARQAADAVVRRRAHILA